MRLATGVILALLLGGGASPEPPSKPGLPVVYVSHEHSRDNPRSSPYVLPPGEGLVLDATQVRFPPLDRPEVPPNVIELAIEGSRFYRTAWQESRRIELTAKTLKGDEESGPFPGLKDGATVVVTIGLVTPIPQTDRISFEVYWTALIKVKTGDSQ